MALAIEELSVRHRHVLVCGETQLHVTLALALDQREDVVVLFDNDHDVRRVHVERPAPDPPMLIEAPLPPPANRHERRRAAALARRRR